MNDLVLSTISFVASKKESAIADRVVIIQSLLATIDREKQRTEAPQTSSTETKEKS